MPDQNKVPVLRSLAASMLLAGLTLAGCNLLPVAQGQLFAASSGAESSISDQSQLMYELMIAELAGRRGYVDIATEGYFSASQRTNDPRVAERATQLAIYSRYWQQAEQAGLRWSELDPDNPEAHQLLAQIYMRQGNSERAAEELDLLVSGKFAESPVALSDIHTFLLREPDRQVAIDTMTRLLERYSGSTGAHLALGQLYYASRNREDALRSVDRAIELDADNSAARMLRAQILSSSGNVDQGFAELKLALGRDSDNIDLRVGYARMLVEAGRYDEASDELERIFDIDKTNAEAMFTIGLLALESRRNQAAKKYFEQLLTLNAFVAEAHYYLGRIADSHQKYEEAIGHYEQVMSGESFIDAQIRAAELYGLTDQIETGRERLRELARYNPNPELRPRLIRAEGRILIAAERVAEAVSVLSEGLEEFQSDSELRYARALAAERSGDKALFESDLRILIEAEPNNAHALNALGYYFADENIHLDEADAYLVRAVQLMPQDPAILDSLGWLRYRQGDIDGSLELLKRAYALLKDAEIAAHLGEVLWISGERESARDIWNQALRDKPDDLKLKSVMERFTE